MNPSTLLSGSERKFAFDELSFSSSSLQSESTESEAEVQPEETSFWNDGKLFWITADSLRVQTSIEARWWWR